MSDEELVAVQEELAEARTELGRIETQAADAEGRAAELESQLTELRERAGQAETAAEGNERELAAAAERTEALEAQVKSAAERYRTVALERSPELPEELVAGETVEEIDLAIERARETVSRVRGHLESRAQARRVPVGAPVRSEPDRSAMSAEEKIKFGLQQQER